LKNFLYKKLEFEKAMIKLRLKLYKSNHDLFRNSISMALEEDEKTKTE